MKKMRPSTRLAWGLLLIVISGLLHQGSLASLRASTSDPAVESLGGNEFADRENVQSQAEKTSTLPVTGLRALLTNGELGKIYDRRVKLMGLDGIDFNESDMEYEASDF